MAIRCPVLEAPHAAARAVSELVLGERFHVTREDAEWLTGWCDHDRYQGQVSAACFVPPGPAPTHRIIARAALRFAAPDIKAPLVDRPPFGALLAVEALEGSFARTTRGFVHTRHLAPLTTPLIDPVAVAAGLMGAPYLWGGRTGEGIDCSGLVQVALAACGIAAPRDTDQQMAALGRPVPPGTPYTRGDLVFFPGHVGFMMDAQTLLHANAHWMTVVAEPLADVAARLSPTHPQPILGARRLGTFA